MEYSPKNNSFDKKWQPNDIEYWRISESILKSGYEFTIDKSDESFDGNSLLVSTDKSLYVPLSKPGEICVSKIDDSMWLSLPLTVYDDGNSTLPKSVLKPENRVTMNPNDMITKVAVFTEMWNYLRLYSNVSFTDEQWDRLFLDNISNITATKSTELFEVELNKILKVTNNIRSDAWRTSQSEDYTLPFLVDFEKGDAVVITSFDKQIEKGDKLISVGDMNVRDFIATKSLQYPGNSIIWKLKKAFYELASGDFKSEEEIKFIRNGEELVVPIARNLTNREVVITRPYTLEWLDSNTIYIDGTRLNDFEMSEMMGNFTKAKGIIIDLRGDALLSEHFLGFFMDESVPTFKWGLKSYISPCKEANRRDINGYVKAKKADLTRNIVFLTNETSVGKSETILQIVKHYGIGKIIGEPTAGSYDMIQEVKLPAMYNISFDIYPMSFGNDNQIKYKSIIPDITIKDKDNYPNDPKIKKAIELLKEKY
ncbi:MAG: S41 family peptidase [Candidatus Kapaibacterium sp.]